MWVDGPYFKRNLGQGTARCKDDFKFNLRDATIGVHAGDQDSTHKNSLRPGVECCLSIRCSRVGGLGFVSGQGQVLKFSNWRL